MIKQNKNGIFYEISKEILQLYQISEERDGFWTTSVELPINIVRCNIECAECDFCESMIEAEGNGNYDVWFRESYKESLLSIGFDD